MNSNTFPPTLDQREVVPRAIDADANVFGDASWVETAAVTRKRWSPVGSVTYAT